MGQVDIQHLRRMVEALTKRVGQLEEYARTLQTTIAKHGIKAPTFGTPADAK